VGRFDKIIHAMVTAKKWIDFIENPNGPFIRNEEKLEYLVNLWKFSEAYPKGTGITPNGELIIAGEATATLNFYIPDMAKAPKSNHFADGVKAAEAVLPHRPGSHHISVIKQVANFNRESLENFKNEVVACINDSLQFYRYISAINRIPLEDTKIHTGLTVKDVSRDTVLSALQHKPAQSSGNKNWLVLLLDNFKSKCDYFYVEDAVLHLPFLSGYEKIFLFDFFKGELTELKTMNDNLNF
jgi:hypothetical protein